ncbi:unnamed protein product [Trichobilharzia regenti]|nr:unnamed protein product [Trichobilharzia regenti]
MLPEPQKYQNTNTLVVPASIVTTINDKIKQKSLKLAGGRLDRSRRLCAFVTQIKPGSPADVVGHLRPGDEILEWNGQSLRGLSADEVSQIIYQSKDEIQVELVAQREIK